MKLLMKNAIKVLVLTFISVQFFTSCNKTETALSDQVLMVPADAGLVIDADLQSLSTKIPSDDIDMSKFQGLPGYDYDNGLLSSLCDDSIKSGIAQTNVVAFLVSEEKFGAAVALDDVVAFENKIKSLSEDESLDIKEKDGIKYCEIDGDSTILHWNESKALFTGGYSLKEALTLFNQTKEQSIATNSEFMSFYADKKDISVWMDMEAYMEFAENSSNLKYTTGVPLMSEFKDMYNGIYASYYMEFLNGEIDVVQKMTPLNKAKKLYDKFYNPAPETALLEATPGKSYLFASGAFKLQELMEMLKSVPEVQNALDDEEAQRILKSIKGDMVISISDFASGPIPIPNAVIGLSVNDKTIFDELTGLDGIQAEEKDGYTVLLVQMFQIYLSQKDDLLLVTTDENIIKAFAAGKAYDENITNSEHKDAAKSVGYFYINLDLDTYPDAIRGMLQSKLGEDFNEISEELCLKDITSSTNYKTCESHTEVKLKNKEVNSLVALYHMVDKIISME